MADVFQIKRIKAGVKDWNEWRVQNPQSEVDLSGASLSGAILRSFNLKGAIMRGVNLIGANLEGVNLSGANLDQANLKGVNLKGGDLSGARLEKATLVSADLTQSVLEAADLAGADLTGANLKEANLSGANLSRTHLRTVNLEGANLSGANLHATDLIRSYLKRANLNGANLNGANVKRANLEGADLSGADLRNANLEKVNLSGALLESAILVKTRIDQARLNNCHIYGLSVWDLEGIPLEQSNLIITPKVEAAITVDNLQVAQFIYLLLKNSNVRNIIDTITSKAVLILGRFTNERKAVLDAIREELRKSNFTPILFDFDRPASKDITGTVETLARMARFIIADLTDPSSIPHELALIVPHLRTTPVLPIKLRGTGGYSMFEDFQRSYQWVLRTHEYTDSASLIAQLPEVIAPANEMAESFRRQY